MPNVTDEQHIAFCRAVQKQAMNTAATCSAALRHVQKGSLPAFMIEKAAKEALALVTFAANEATGVQLAADQTGVDAYDLNALGVNLVDTAPELGEL